MLCAQSGFTHLQPQFNISRAWSHMGGPNRLSPLKLFIRPGWWQKGAGFSACKWPGQSRAKAAFWDVKRAMAAVVMLLVVQPKNVSVAKLFLGTTLWRLRWGRIMESRYRGCRTPTLPKPWNFGWRPHVLCAFLDKVRRHLLEHSLLEHPCPWLGC